MSIQAIEAAIRDVKDFPTEGIIFKDISPVLQDPELFRLSIELMAGAVARSATLQAKPDMIVAIEARGFIFGAALACQLGCGMTMLRKKGKLPWKTESLSYDLEYGSSEIEIHTDAIKPGDSVLVVDDVLATGGTAEAAVKLVEKLGGKVTALACLLELSFLNGRDKLGSTPVHTLIKVN